MIEIKRLRQKELDVTIEGLTQLVTHKWSEKAKKQMRDKQQGIRGKMREVKNPQEDFESACYRLSDGSFGFPVVGIKAAIIFAAHKDLGISRVDVRQGLFIHADDPSTNLVRIIGPDPKMREDVVRVGMGAADLRYRPEFQDWSIRLRILYDEEKLTAESVVNLLERAGFGVGLGEWRPEKGGEWGRFQVAVDQGKKTKTRKGKGK